MPKADIRDSPPLAVLEINIGLDRGYTNMLDVSVMRMQRATTFPLKCCCLFLLIWYVREI